MINDIIINLIANIIWSTILAILTNPIKVFSYKISDKSKTAELSSNIRKPFFSFSACTLCFYFLALVSGGFVWNVINRLFGWTFYMAGGLHGVYALLWGFITIMPLVFFTILGSFSSKRISKNVFFKLISISFLYSIFAGNGAIIFYDLPFREYFEHLHISYLSREICIVTIWSILISTVSAFFISLVINDSKHLINPTLIYFQIPLTCLMSIIGVMLSSVFQLDVSTQVQIRGLFAAFGFRIGLMIGLIIASRNTSKSN
jgi:hypothetical protein